MSWTDERVELLRKLAGDGLKASEIAAELGVTRNAVIGKARRRGINLISRQAINVRKGREKKKQSSSEDLPKTEVRRRPPVQFKYPLEVQVPVVETEENEVKLSTVNDEKKLPPYPGSLNKIITDLEEAECKFPTGQDGKIHLHCGQPTGGVRIPNCPHHTKVSNTGHTFKSKEESKTTTQTSKYKWSRY